MEDIQINGDWIDANVSGNIGVDRIEGLGEYAFTMLTCKKPYLINLNNVESIVGEWNKDKTEYGVRVYYVSGNNIWFGGDVARKFLCRVGNEEAEQKFKAISIGS